LIHFYKRYYVSTLIISIYPAKSFLFTFEEEMMIEDL